MFFQHSVVNAQAETPTPQPTSTLVPIIQTSTPVPTDYYDCPSSPPVGWGTVTPSGVWQLRCGTCEFHESEFTPEPTIVGPTPTPDWQGLWIHKVGETILYDNSNANYWYTADFDVPEEYFSSYNYPKFTVMERLYPNSNHQLIRDVDNCYVAYYNLYTQWENSVGITGNIAIALASSASGLNVVNTHPGGPLICTQHKNGKRTFNVRREDGTFGPAIKIHYFMMKDYPPVNDRIYEVKWIVDNIENDLSYTGRMKASCSDGDTAVGMYVAHGIQASNITGVQSYARILDTGFSNIQSVGGSYESQVSVYESSASGSAVDIYPYADAVDANIQSPVYFDYSRNFLGGQVSYEFSLVCYGTGFGSLSNIGGYCSVIEPAEELDLALPVPSYQDGNCFTTPSITIGDITIPSFELCTRTVSFGTLSIFGIDIDVNKLAKAMAAFFAMFLLLRN